MVTLMKIQEVAERTGVSIHALRYYEQTGLVTPVERKVNGHREYSADDLYRIHFVLHLRSAGMPIAEIKRYTDLAGAGDATIGERLALLEAHQAAVEAKIIELTEHLTLIRNKITHYREFHQTQLIEQGKAG